MNGPREFTDRFRGCEWEGGVERVCIYIGRRDFQDWISSNLFVYLFILNFAVEGGWVASRDMVHPSIRSQ